MIQDLHPDKSRGKGIILKETKLLSSAYLGTGQTPKRQTGTMYALS